MKTLPINDELFASLEKMSKDQGLDVTGFITQALGTYKFIISEQEKGSKFIVSRKKRFWRWEDYEIKF